MEFTFFGTSSGTPTRDRHLTSLAIASANGKSWYMVDCGEATQHQVMRSGYSLAKLEAIFITHLHGDHCYGLPGVLASMAMSERTRSITIVAPQLLQPMMAAIQEYSRLWLKFEVKFMAVEGLLHQRIGFKDFQVTAIPLSHRLPSYAYHFVEAAIEHRLDTQKLLAHGIPASEVWGQLQQGNNVTLADGQRLLAADFVLTDRSPRCILVGGDNDTPGLLAQAPSKPDVLIHEATYTQVVLDKVGPEPQHSSAKMIAEYATSAHIEQLILTHFSPRYAYSRLAKMHISDIANEASAYYQGLLFLANDLDTFLLAKDKRLSLVKSHTKPMN